MRIEDAPRAAELAARRRDLTGRAERLAAPIAAVSCRLTLAGEAVDLSMAERKAMLGRLVRHLAAEIEAIDRDLAAIGVEFPAAEGPPAWWVEHG